jgi:ketosteroid isomerase-like protein
MKIALAATALLAACATVPEKDPAASLAAAETAFAAHSVREDMRVAFLAHFAPDGVLVRNRWMTAHEALDAQPAPPIVLDWRPVHVEAAASGDLGLSTGPWRITRKGESAPRTFGQFVSVWTRQGDGPWQVAIDIGISHPGPALWDAGLQATTTPGQSAGHDADPSLAQAEAAFARESATDGSAAAWRHWAAQDVRFYREGAAPRLGFAAAAAAFDDVRRDWTVDRMATARSNDFGYVRGTVRNVPAGSIAGYYLRVWRREAAGWRIAADVFNAKAQP